MIDIHWSRVIDNRCKLCKLLLFFTFLLDDNGARSSEFCLSFLILHKVGLFCSNNELAALKQKRESGVGFTQ